MGSENFSDVGDDAPGRGGRGTAVEWLASSVDPPSSYSSIWSHVRILFSFLFFNNFYL